MDINNSMDIIDTRDIEKKIKELNSEIDDLYNEIFEIDDQINELDEDDKDYEDELEDYKNEKEDYENEKKDYEDELEILIKIKDEVGHGFEDGIALINEDHFEDYVKDYLTEIGDLPHEIPWYIEIDWAKTAENVQQDYSQVDFDGHCYYYRNY